MRQFMQPRNTILKGTQNESPTFGLTPNSSRNPSKQRAPGVTTGSNSSRKNKSSGSKENAPPLLSSDSNQAVMDYASQGDVRKLASSPMSVAKIKSPLPPRPPLKRKLSMEASGSKKATNSAAGSSADSGVKVIVRMRPLNRDEEEGETIVQKMSNDSLSMAGHTFTFDAISDFNSRQIDIFELVGAPLVENCLAGFNSSVFAYGQTGSGKTYTVWGPAKALEENLSNDEQGLTPRVFQRLFERIYEEQSKHADRQLVYQCRCSFLEIYNEQITDLLEPSQKNLLLREDVKTGVYVENLTEEYVNTMKDVAQLLIKGFSNRRTGSTSINADSSRSHSVFTCVVQSRCKGKSDGLSYLKTSRINLVDLAGSERQKLTGAAGERLKEAGNINRSLSQLGNLINILAEVSQTGKQRHIPYRDSKLTFLLQESLGGNAKLAMICAISPSQRCKNETFSTLRFAQRAKAIKNKATMNEEMPDDVNELREVIRQLKDELLLMKSDSTQTELNGTTSKRWNARRSLNLLKFSLNRPMTLPQIDDDSDEEMEIVQLDEPVSLQSACNERELLHETSRSSHRGEPALEDTDINMEEVVDQIDKDENEEPVESIIQNEENEEPKNHVPEEISKQDTPENKMESTPSSKKLEGGCRTTDPSLIPSDISPILKSPPPSTSPTVSNSSRKSLRTSSVVTASHKYLGNEKLKLLPPCLSIAKPSNSVCLDLSRKRTRSLRSTQHLAASLHRGLEILDGHHQGGSIRRSSFRTSNKAAFVKAIPSVAKVDVGIQTLPPETTSLEECSSVFLCSKCKNRNSQEEYRDANDCSNLKLVPVEESLSSDKFKSQVPKAVEKVLAGAIRREMAFEEMCAKQNSEIMHLNRLVQQYKHERECNAILSQTREDKIYRLESLMDGILSTEEFKDEEILSVAHEHQLLKEKYENHPEILRTKIELKRVQDDLQRYRNFFDLGERDVLLEEIKDLRNQLQFYVDSSSKFSRKKSPLLQCYSCQPSLASALCTVPESNAQNAERRFEQERIQWDEAEGQWISAVENMRAELEATQTLLLKERQELVSEKKCSEELKEAMQLAMEGHARMLEQYAELEEKHIELLAKHRSFQDGVEDVKKAAVKAGVRGAESKFINALAAEISALRVDREKERRYFRDEIKGLQAQLRDTAEAVEAAGELLVRLKEAEEAIAAAENRAIEAERELQMAYKLKDTLVHKHEEEICALKQLCENSNPSKEVSKIGYDEPKAVTDDIVDTSEQWREEFAPYYVSEEGESSHLESSSWFTGYDRCNI